MSARTCLHAITPHADRVKETTAGTRSSSAALMANGMKPSETIQVTGGVLEDKLLLSLAMRSRKGVKKFVTTAFQREILSWLASVSEGERPSGMVSKQKSGEASKASEPLDFKKRL